MKKLPVQIVIYVAALIAIVLLFQLVINPLGQPVGGQNPPEDGVQEKEKPSIKLIEIAKEEWSDDYPIDVCVVGETPLDGMGGPFAYKYGDQEVRFCCKGCVGAFEKSPEKYLKVLTDALAKAEAKVTPPATQPE